MPRSKRYINQKEIFKSVLRRQWVQPHKDPLTYDQIKNIYRTIFKVMCTALVDGRIVNIGDLGSLQIVEYPERKVVSPLTNTEIVTPAKKKLKFTRSKNFEKVIKQYLEIE